MWPSSKTEAAEYYSTQTSLILIPKIILNKTIMNINFIWYEWYFESLQIVVILCEVINFYSHLAIHYSLDSHSASLKISGSSVITMRPPPSWGLKCWPSSAFYSCFRDVSKMITIPCHILENTLHHYWLKHELRKFSGSDSSRPLYWTLRYLVLLKNNLRYFRGVSASWARLQRSTPTQMRSPL